VTREYRMQLGCTSLKYKWVEVCVQNAGGLHHKYRMKEVALAS